MIAPLVLSFIFLGVLAGYGHTYSMETNAYIVVGTVFFYLLRGGGKSKSVVDDGVDYKNNIKCWENGQDRDLDLTEYNGSVVDYIKGEKSDGTKDQLNDEMRQVRASYIHHFGDDADIKEVTDYLENNQIAGVNTTTKAITRDTARAVTEKHNKVVKQLSSKLDKAETELKSIGRAYANKIENERRALEETIIDVTPLQTNLLAR